MGARIIVDKETGEGHYIKAERFIKTMVEVWRYVDRKNIFTTAEEKTLHRLSMFLQLNTNAIINPTGDYMNIEDMANETGIDRSNIRKSIKMLMKKNALGMWKSGDREIYYMNPFLFQTGNIKPFLFNLFDEKFHERAKKESLKKFMAGKKITSIILENSKDPKEKPAKTKATA